MSSTITIVPKDSAFKLPLGRSKAVSRNTKSRMWKNPAAKVRQQPYFLRCLSLAKRITNAWLERPCRSI